MSKLKQLRKKVEQVIADFNRGKPETALIRLVWGSADAEDDQFFREFGQQQALLNYSNEDYELSLGRRPCPDYTDRLRLSLSCDPHILPRSDARRLYNVFANCQESVYPMLSPDAESDSEIIVYGVEVSIPLGTVTPGVLEDALIRLSLSAASMRPWLVEGGEEGDDRWEEHRKWFDSDEGDGT
jgi:hypothetical protein